MWKFWQKSTCVLAFGLAIGATFPAIGIADEANTEPLTGCLTKSGRLVNLAFGDTATRPCNRHQQQVTIGGGEPAPEQMPVVFITSEVFRGNLGGIAGADAHCQRLAENAGLHGTYRAWLSDSQSSPAADPSFFKSPNGYVRVDGVKVAATWDDLTDGALLAAIEVDENGDHEEQSRDAS